MELYDFNRYNMAHRAAAVWEKGHFLAVRQSGDCRICLYAMGKFFAEVWYQTDNNQIELVRGFKSIACLQPYLELVDLSDIIS
ncbi:hypothetical protein [Adhaeribacter rhizoryzae]|uniref:Uncharacterized protein n=1 Tax=Adhaeribacter rhizoryzae TaxID=2607907 RepID=A0A5M6CXM2_9BACT|nr:hypothetical protein [Adhaeribacter rhizoryzae]KAA5539160.1 hypothetical protein F0145_25155 [Adhaeribacter rhizoryzae]